MQLATQALRIGDQEVQMLTLPGQAQRDASDGRWYYQINRPAAVSILKESFAHEAGWDGTRFDPQTRFCNTENQEFEAIYRREDTSAERYSVDELNREGIDVPMTP